MKKNNKINELPRATAEMAQRVNELQAMAQQPGADLEAINKEYCPLVESHNWYNYEFTDPETGKVGVKDVAGNILVPAHYDGACFLESYLVTPRAPHMMQRDGKCGIVAADGSGKELSPFKFDALRHVDSSPLYVAWWGNERDRFGLVLCDGTVIVQNILTGCSAPWNDIVFIEADGKHGAIDITTLQVVLPEYDEVYPDENELVVFRKGEVHGYIDTEGRFVTVKDYESDNYEGEGCFLSTTVD